MEEAGFEPGQCGSRVRSLASTRAILLAGHPAVVLSLSLEWRWAGGTSRKCGVSVTFTLRQAPRHSFIRWWFVLPTGWPGLEEHSQEQRPLDI